MNIPSGAQIKLHRKAISICFLISIVLLSIYGAVTYIHDQREEVERQNRAADEAAHERVIAEAHISALNSGNVVATPQAPEQPLATPPVVVDMQTRTVTARVVSHIGDAPTGTVYRMDLGSVGMENGMGGYRVGCIGRVLLQGNQLKEDHFLHGKCKLPDVGGTMTFRFVAGIRVLINIEDAQWDAEQPEFADVWQTNLPVAYSLMQEGSLSNDAALSPPWRELMYHVNGQGSVDAGWSIAKNSGGEPLHLSCIGLVIPRPKYAPIFLESYCPDLDPNINLGGLRVGIARLTTTDSRNYDFGVESFWQEDHWPHFEYKKD